MAATMKSKVIEQEDQPAVLNKGTTRLAVSTKISQGLAPRLASPDRSSRTLPDLRACICDVQLPMNLAAQCDGVHCLLRIHIGQTRGLKAGVERC